MPDYQKLKTSPEIIFGTWALFIKSGFVFGFGGAILLVDAS